MSLWPAPPSREYHSWWLPHEGMFSIGLTSERQPQAPTALTRDGTQTPHTSTRPTDTVPTLALPHTPSTGCHPATQTAGPLRARHTHPPPVTCRHKTPRLSRWPREKASPGSAQKLSSECPGLWEHELTGLLGLCREDERMKGPRGLGSNPAAPLPSSVTSDGPLSVPKSE